LWLAISRALAKRPYERFASCGEFADAIRRAVDASEEDFAHALQELRPRSEAIPDDGKGLGSLSASASSSRARKKPARRRSMLWTLSGVVGVALLAISGTLAVTRPSTSTAHADDSRATPPPSALPAVSIGLNTTPSSPPHDEGSPADLNAVPPPDPATDVGDLGGPATVGATPTPLAGKPSTSSGGVGGATHLPAPRTTSSPTGKPTGTTKPGGATKPVATSPGF